MNEVNLHRGNRGRPTATRVGRTVTGPAGLQRPGWATAAATDNIPFRQVECYNPADLVLDLYSISQSTYLLLNRSICRRKQTPKIEHAQLRLRFVRLNCCF